MSFDLKFLVRQSYLRKSQKCSPKKTFVLSKLYLRDSTFYVDDVISRNSPNMMSANKMVKDLHNYSTS